jgi:hypothetical protein
VTTYENYLFGFQLDRITNHKIITYKKYRHNAKTNKMTKKKEGLSLSTGVLYHRCITELVNTFHVSYTRINGIT